MTAARRQPPAEASRRGWCPSLARPMPTGDGLLARIHPPLGVLSAAQLRAVAEAARSYGNGHIDITARGNLQVRGVSAETACPLATRLTEAGLGDVRADGGPQRLTLTSHLAGHDPDASIDVMDLARAVEAVGLTIAGLPAKTLVAIESGERRGLGEAEADVLIRPTGAGRVAIGLASDTAHHWCPDIDVADAPGALGRALTAFVSTGQRRMRDLEPDMRRRIAAAAEPPRASHSALGRTRERVEARRAEAVAPATGLIVLPSATVIVVEAAFGRCRAGDLDLLARISETARGSVHTTASRGFATAFDGEADARAALDRLLAAGFVTDPADPRRAVAACPGAPACASGSTPVPDHAARLAAAFAPFAARGHTAHVSGCAKGCAHPRAADLTLVAETGLYRTALGAAPGEAGARSGLTFEAALDRVRRADPARPLADAFPS